VVQPLEGFTIGVTADRRREEQSELLRRRGARVIDAPCIRTLALGAEDGMRAATDELIARPPQFLVANTGIGLRSWLAAAATWDLEHRLLEALSTTRILARGPKAAGAMLTAGLDVWWQAPSEQLREVRDRLLDEPLAGARVAIQLHGDDDQDLTAAVRQRGAETVEVPVYRWTLPEDPRPVARLIDEVCARRVDAVTFTAAPAVKNLFALAESTGTAEDLRQAFAGGVVAACIGPVCAGAAGACGIEERLVPDRWRLGALVHAVADHLGARRRRLRIGDADVLIQGALVVVDGASQRLTDRERGVLEALLRRPGATVARSTLLRDVWGSAHTDAHNLDVTVARLRAKFGRAGAGIETAPRRGYRLGTPAGLDYGIVS
jgi:uroporphyrinogen-III synthase